MVTIIHKKKEKLLKLFTRAKYYNYSHITDEQKVSNKDLTIKTMT